MIGILLLVAGCIFYYRLGQHEYDNGFVCAGLSLTAWMITWVALGWGWMGYLGGQLAVLAGMTWYNLRRRSG